VQVARQERAAAAAAAAATAAAAAAAAAAPAPGIGSSTTGGDEVRQCLEHIISMCIGGGGSGADASVGAERGGGDETGLDSGAVSVEEATDESGIRVGQEDQHAPEALLPGFELSAKERRKVRLLL